MKRRHRATLSDKTYSLLIVHDKDPRYGKIRLVEGCNSLHSCDRLMVPNFLPFESEKGNLDSERIFGIDVVHEGFLVEIPRGRLVLEVDNRLQE